MLCLTKKTDYALLALSHLAERKGAGATAASAREIAERFGLPLPLLMNVLKELAKARLVTSVRGAAGGYSLALKPEQVRVLEVVTAMEGPVRFAQCANDLPVAGQGCPIGDRCSIQPTIRRLSDRLIALLEELTLADLMEGRVDVPAHAVGAGTGARVAETGAVVGQGDGSNRPGPSWRRAG